MTPRPTHGARRSAAWAHPIASFMLLTLLLAAPCLANPDCDCPPLGPPATAGTSVTVANMAALRAALANASGSAPTTIYLEDNVYSITASDTIWIGTANVTLRSKNGDPQGVIIEGTEATDQAHGITIAAEKVTIADLTIRDIPQHGLFITGEGHDCHIYNVVVTNAGGYLIRAVSGADAPRLRSGRIACSKLFFASSRPPSPYAGGINLSHTAGWVVRNNRLSDIRRLPAGEPAGPAIVAWRAAADTIVEGNRLIDCDRGITFGATAASGVRHHRGLIRNNTIKGHADSAAGIQLLRTADAIVEHNTVYFPGGGLGYSIEARHVETTNVIIRNNFTNAPILPNREGALATITHNSTDAGQADFVGAATGDLHLVSGASAIDMGTAVGERVYDLDCGPVSGSAPDRGADEWGSGGGSLPEAPSAPRLIID